MTAKRIGANFYHYLSELTDTEDRVLTNSMAVIAGLMEDWEVWNAHRAPSDNPMQVSDLIALAKLTLEVSNRPPAVVGGGELIPKDDLSLASDAP